MLALAKHCRFRSMLAAQQAMSNNASARGQVNLSQPLIGPSERSTGTSHRNSPSHVFQGPRGASVHHRSDSGAERRKPLVVRGTMRQLMRPSQSTPACKSSRSGAIKHTYEAGSSMQFRRVSNYESSFNVSGPQSFGLKVMGSLSTMDFGSCTCSCLLANEPPIDRLCDVLPCRPETAHGHQQPG